MILSSCGPSQNWHNIWQAISYVINCLLYMPIISQTDNIQQDQLANKHLNKPLIFLPNTNMLGHFKMHIISQATSHKPLETIHLSNWLADQILQFNLHIEAEPQWSTIHIFQKKFPNAFYRPSNLAPSKSKSSISQPMWPSCDLKKQ